MTHKEHILNISCEIRQLGFIKWNFLILLCNHNLTNLLFSWTDVTRKEEKGQTFSAEKFPSDVKPNGKNDGNIKTTKQRKVERSRKTIKFVWKSGWRAVLQWMTDKWPPTPSNEINREGKESNCEAAFLWKEKERKNVKVGGKTKLVEGERWVALSTPQARPSCFRLYKDFGRFRNLSEIKSLGQRWAARREERKIYFLAFSTPQTPPSCFTLYNNSSAKMNPYRWGNCQKQWRAKNRSNDPYFKKSKNIANWNTSRTIKSKWLQILSFPLKMYLQ